MPSSAGNTLAITDIELRNFRCFSHFKTAFDGPIVLVEGGNGSGKTSLLEAVYYACYLRSFRSGSPRELIHFGRDNFFVSVGVQVQSDTRDAHRIQVGFADGKRIVRANQRKISSYRELMEYVRVVCLSEDDLAVVRGSPQSRRLFLDHALLLHDPDYAQRMRTFRQVVDNRNALLRGAWRADVYAVMTEQLWHASRAIEEQRSVFLSELQARLGQLITCYFDDEFSIDLAYRATAGEHESFDSFFADPRRLEGQERRMCRSVFGAHLDDFCVEMRGKRARTFASRGQQKLVALLLRLAQLGTMAQLCAPQPPLLIDDFMADFDEKTTAILLNGLRDTGLQLVFTSPVSGGFLSNKLLDMGCTRIDMTG